MVRRDTNDQPNGLTPYEQRVLTSVETALRREDPALERTLSGRRHWLPAFAFAAPTCLAYIVAGVVLMVVGLTMQLVLVAFAGFVAVLFGASNLLETGPIVTRMRKLVGLDPPGSW